MRASILIASHNEGDALWKTIRACVEGTTGLTYEIIVADDASDDGSIEEALKRFPQIRIVAHAEREGASPTKHRAALEAAGETLVFLDGHTNPEFGALKRLVEDVELLKGDAIITPAVPNLEVNRWQNSRSQVGHGYSMRLDTLACQWVPLNGLQTRDISRRRFHESPALIGCAVAVSRGLYQELQGFDSDMRFWGVEDIDFGLKGWLLGYPVLHDSQVRIGHRFRRQFDNYAVPNEHIVANQIRFARKHLTSATWTQWVEACRQRHSGPLAGHPEGLWARAWQIFEERRASVEQERHYLNSRRKNDEFWYAERFNLEWPRLDRGSIAISSPQPEEKRSTNLPLAAFTLSSESFDPSPSPSPGPGGPTPPPCNCCPTASSPDPGWDSGFGGSDGGSGGCGTGQCYSAGDGGNGMTIAIAYPVRYDNGQIGLLETDLSSDGFGGTWVHQRSYCNQLSANEDVGQGYNWLVFNCPYLVDDAGTIVVVRSTTSSLWFDPSGGAYVARHGEKATLTHDTTNHRFVLTLRDGTQQVYYDFSNSLVPVGKFLRQTAPGGAVTEVTSFTDDDQIAEIHRSGTVGGQPLTEAFAYTYTDQRITDVTLRRQLGTSGWEDVRRALYEYYDGTNSFGSEGDLKRVLRQVPVASGWEDSEIFYYRYYVEEELDGFVHGLKFVVQPETYNRMLSASVDPLTASNGTLATYADKYFEYDNDQRVTLERIEGGSRTFELDYTDGTVSTDYNVCKTRTVVTQPDGTQEIAYTNALGQPLIFEFTDGTQRWISASHYDMDANIIWFANPSAVIDYDDSSPTLDIELRASDGPIEVTDYYTTTGSGAAKGYVSARKLKKGYSGTPILQESLEYSSQIAGGVTVFQVSKQTLYRNDNGTGAIETTNAYTYYSGTTQVQQQTTTLPIVPTNQNGSGVAATRKSYFDADGRLTWSMDERGYITRRLYDLGTGALVRQIDDVDTSLYMDVPSGWSTPGDGGKNLVTDYLSDDEGRTTQVLGPLHTIDIAGTATAIRRATWTVFDDVTHTTYSGRGYQTGTSPAFEYVLINPVSITKLDAAGKVLEEIQAISAVTDGTLAEVLEGAGSGASAFPQSSYSRWTTNQYIDCCLAVSQRVYHTIPASGTGADGTNYDQTEYGYDVMKRRNRIVTPGGTITRQVYDVRSLATAVWVGTNDDGGTSDDPSGAGADPDNDMVIVTSNVYDNGNDGQDGNLTEQTQHVSSTDSRVTEFVYDWRDRRIETDGEIDFFEQVTYDNLNHVVETRRYDTSSTGNLTAKSETKYDDRGSVYRTIRYGVAPATGTIGNSLIDNTWFDAAGNAIKTLPAGSDLFTKTAYDSLGRPIAQYLGYDLDETSYADAGSVSDDTILEQSETVYDDASDVVETIKRQRYHNAPAAQTGALQDPSNTPKARVTYSATYPDALGRMQAAADYGTNGGTALTRAATIPNPSNDILVTFTSYDEAGNTLSTTDPSGMVTRMGYDDRGRAIEQIQNFQASLLEPEEDEGGCSASDDVNVTVQTSYNADGNVATLTAVNAETGDQVTTYVYGTTLANSGIASSTLKRKEVYPDSTGASDTIQFAYNRQGQCTTRTDQNGTVHSYDYDLLGRMTLDRITAVGTGIDGTIRRIGMTYEVRGLRRKTTSYDNATVGSGTVLNEVQSVYNDFGQLVTEYQAHGGPVNTSTTPKVQYGYADGSDNTIRPTLLVYPNGRELTYSYGTAGSMADAASRPSAIIDDDDTHLVDYEYLGRGTFVVADDTEPRVRWTLLDLTGANDPDTGDIYGGLDRFGRIKDNRWYNYDAEEDVDRLQYGYDRASNRLWRADLVAQSLSEEFDELYSYDGIHRLKTMGRGLLNGTETALTSQAFAQCWTLDSTANWSGMKQADTGGSWTLEQTRTANQVNEITEITNAVGSAWSEPSYDAAGNMTTMPQPASPTDGFTAIYDAWNRMVKVTDGEDTIGEYQYDGLRRRILQKTYVDGTLNEARDSYFTSRWQTIEERVGDSEDAERQYVWGLQYVDGIVLRERDVSSSGTLDERLYAGQDATWNVTVLFDSSGILQERFAYSAYGSPMFLSPAFAVEASSTALWTLLYCGYIQDEATALYNVRNRSYSSLTGGWLQRDPIGYMGGVNLYAARFVPNGSDPYGLIALADDVIEGIAIGIAIAAAAMLAWLQANKPKTAPKPSGDWWNGLPRMGNAPPEEEPPPAPTPKPKPRRIDWTKYCPRNLPPQPQRRQNCQQRHGYPKCPANPHSPQSAASEFLRRYGRSSEIPQGTIFPVNRETITEWDDPTKPDPICSDGRPGTHYHFGVMIGDPSLGLYGFAAAPSNVEVSVMCCRCCAEENASQECAVGRVHWSETTKKKYGLTHRQEFDIPFRE